MQTLSEMKPDNVFIVTSNIDEQFQKAGFAEDRVYECHGSLGIHALGISSKVASSITR